MRAVRLKHGWTDFTYRPTDSQGGKLLLFRVHLLRDEFCVSTRIPDICLLASPTGDLHLRFGMRSVVDSLQVS
jgi:hypothetical protein